MSKNENTNKPVLLIDSECKFCSRSMQFIIKHGGEDKYIFHSLYSDEGRKILHKYDFPKDYNESIVLIENEKAYIKSEAALRIAKNLNGILPALYWFKVVPVTIRDAAYNFVSRHRHRII